jgi:prophage maintenance system killer protein
MQCLKLLLEKKLKGYNMDKIKKNTNPIVIYKNKDGTISVNVQLSQETMWLSLNQIANLFEKDKSVISRHLRNIFNEGELEETSTVANFATVQIEGNHEVKRRIDYYNLDAIISVGYRVNSKIGTEFRRWASQVLKDHLVKGYSINQSNLNDLKIMQLQQTIDLLATTLVKQELVSEIGNEVIAIIRKYTKTWDLLLRYDENRLETIKFKTQDNIIDLPYQEAITAINTFRVELIKKGEASELFGRERDGALKGILGNILQTWDGIALYNSNTERAAHLLYFIIKDHPFSDGNKRIGSLLFLIYLKKSKIVAKIDNNSLIALALLVAESEPSQKEIMIQLIINLLV